MLDIVESYLAPVGLTEAGLGGHLGKKLCSLQTIGFRQFVRIILRWDRCYVLEVWVPQGMHSHMTVQCHLLQSRLILRHS